MTKLIVAFRNFANATKKETLCQNFFHPVYVVALYTYKYICICVCSHTHTHKLSSSEDCTMSTPDSLFLAIYYEGYQIEDRGMGEECGRHRTHATVKVPCRIALEGPKYHTKHLEGLIRTVYVPLQ